MDDQGIFWSPHWLTWMLWGCCDQPCCCALQGKLVWHRQLSSMFPSPCRHIYCFFCFVFFTQTKNYLKRLDNFFPQILAFPSPFSSAIFWNAHENREMETWSMINQRKLLLQLLIRVVDVSYLLFKKKKRSKTFIILMLKRWKSDLGLLGLGQSCFSSFSESLCEYNVPLYPNVRQIEMCFVFITTKSLIIEVKFWTTKTPVVYERCWVYAWIMSLGEFSSLFGIPDP